MRTPLLRTAAVILGLALAGGSLVACSSDSTEGSSSFDPKAAATKLRGLGAVRTAGHGSYGEERGPIAGRINYSPYRFTIRAAVPTGQILARPTLVRVGEDMWVNRAALTATDRGIPLGPGTLTLRGPTATPYIKLRNLDEPFASYLAYPFEPAALLDRVAETKTQFDSDGSSAVDGTDRSRFTAELSVENARKIGVRAITVWVDDRGVPVKLRLSTAVQGNIEYTVQRSAQAVRVSAPDPAKIEDTSRPLPDATAPYTEVLSTTAGAVPITVLYAPADLGWTCWKVESDPPFEGLADTRPSGGTCAVPVLPDDLPEDQWSIPLGTTKNAPYNLLGLVVPPESVATFHILGKDPVTVDALPSGLVLYAGPPDAVPGLVTVKTPATTLVCGPAGIDNEADFQEAQSGDAGSYDQYRGLPWACLSEDAANSLSG